VEESVEEGAEFEDAGADGLDREGKRQDGGFVDEEDDTVKFAFTGPAGKSEADRMEEIATANIEFFFQERDDFLEAVGGEKRGIEQEESKFTDDIAGGIAGENGVGFRRLEGARGVIEEDEVQEFAEAGTIECELAEQGGGAFAEGEVFGGGLAREPGVFLQEGENVVRRKGIDVRAMPRDMVVGHGISLA